MFPAGIDLWKDVISQREFNALSHRVPVLINARPFGLYSMVDIDAKGGLQMIVKQLLDAGSLDGSCVTCTGETLAEQVRRRRRRRLEQWFNQGVARIACLPWEAPTGLRWAKLLADLRASGQALPIKDSLIAVTAIVHGLTVVTRNTRDFRTAGVKVLDPFA